MGGAEQETGVNVMPEIDIVDGNAKNICEYSMCGYKNIKQEGYRRKADWLRKRFSEGMVFKILRSHDGEGVGFIEYTPGEYAWRAVEATGYTFVHCIMIYPKKYKGKGYGALLLKECVEEARKGRAHGVAAVTSKGTWMAGKELFLRNGFELVDEAPATFELLVKRFKKKAVLPKFKGDWDKKIKSYGKGLTIIRSDQCPCIAKFVREIVETAREKYGLDPQMVELTNCLEAQNTPSPYATSCMIYNGKLAADHPISNRRFINIMEKEAGKHAV